MSPILKGVVASQISGHLSSPDFVLIQTLTGNGSASTLDFTSIPSTYKHLRMIGNINNTSGATHPSVEATLNGDSAANYSYGYISNNSIGFGQTRSNLILPTVATNTGGVFDIFFTDYTNTSKYKNALSDGGDTTYTDNEIAWWRNTAAINRITIGDGAGALSTSSVVSLYGLKG